MTGYPVICKNNKISIDNLTVTSNLNNKKNLIDRNVDVKWSSISGCPQVLGSSNISNIDKLVTQNHNFKDYKIRYSRPDGNNGFNTANNLLKYSEQFDNSIWTKRTSTTVIANNEIAPNNTLTADEINAVASGITNNNGLFQIINTGNPVKGRTFTFNVWLKYKSGDDTISINLTDGNDAFGDSIICTLTSEWQKFTISAIIGDSSESTIRATIGDFFQTTPFSCYIWGASLWEGEEEYIYYPTTNTTYNKVKVFEDPSNLGFDTNGVYLSGYKYNTCGIGNGSDSIYFWSGLDGKEYRYINANDGSSVTGTYNHSLGLVLGNGDKISYVVFEDGEIYPICEGSSGVLTEITSGGYKNGYISLSLQSTFWSSGSFAINWDFYGGYNNLQNYAKNNIFVNITSNSVNNWSSSYSANIFSEESPGELKLYGDAGSGTAWEFYQDVSYSVVSGTEIKGVVDLEALGDLGGFFSFNRVKVQVLSLGVVQETFQTSLISPDAAPYATYSISGVATVSGDAIRFVLVTKSSSNNGVGWNIKNANLYIDYIDEGYDSKISFTSLNNFLDATEKIPSKNDLLTDAFGNELENKDFTELYSISNNLDSNNYYDFAKISSLGDFFIVVSDVQSNLVASIGQLVITEELLTLDNVAGKGAIIPRAKQFMRELSDGTYFKIFQKNNFDFRETLQAVDSVKQQELLAAYQYNWRYPLYYIREPLYSLWDGIAGHVHWRNAQEFWNYTQDLKENGYDVKIELVAAGGV